MAVQVIKRQTLAPQVQIPQVGIRTCCYVRVSSLSDEQSGSYSSQATHFQTIIKADPELVYAGIYGDEGVTGTSLEHREGFKQMMRDAEAHKFDQIYTKSISRFGRNVLDSLTCLRRLKELGISVKFWKEGVDTKDGTGELLLLILSSLSQAESQSISENVKMGIRYRFQEGKHFVNCSRLLGFDKVDGELVINPTEAAVVRRIFSEYLNGQSVDMITNNLTRDQVPTGVGKTRWYPTTVRYILSNEKYAGDLRLQKFVVPNFLTHRVKRNTGEADQFYVENSHDPIVPREVFDLAQVETARRQSLIHAATPHPTVDTDGAAQPAVDIDGPAVDNGAGARQGFDGAANTRSAEGAGVAGVAAGGRKISSDVAVARAKGTRYGSRLALQGRTRCSCGALLKRKRSNPGRWCCPECRFSISEAALQGAVLDSFRKLETEEDNLRLLLSHVEEVLEAQPVAPHVPVVVKRDPNLEGGDDRVMTEEERAAALFQRYHLLNALDWIHNQGKESLGREGTCYTLEQFIDVTRPKKLTEWCDETVLRFVEGLEIGGAGLVVKYRAGVSVRVPLAQPATTRDVAELPERTE